MSSVEVVNKMQDYLRRASRKIEGYRHVVTGIFNKNQKQKFTNDIFEDFTNLYRLRKIEEIQKSHSLVTKEYKEKIAKLREETDKLVAERQAEIRREHEKFLEAKRNGLASLVNYKLTRHRFRTNNKWIKEKQKYDYVSMMRRIEEQDVLARTTLGTTKNSDPSHVKEPTTSQSSKPAPKLSFMWFRPSSSTTTKIVASANNILYIEQEIKKYDNVLNQLNRVQAAIEKNKSTFESVSELQNLVQRLNHQYIVDVELLDRVTLTEVANLNRRKLEYIKNFRAELIKDKNAWKNKIQTNKNVLYHS
jgi:hypothetical protein